MDRNELVQYGREMSRSCGPGECLVLTMEEEYEVHLQQTGKYQRVEDKKCTRKVSCRKYKVENGLSLESFLFGRNLNFDFK